MVRSQALVHPFFDKIPEDKRLFDKAELEAELARMTTQQIPHEPDAHPDGREARSHSLSR